MYIYIDIDIDIDIQKYYTAVSRRWKTVPGLGTAAGQFRSEVLGVGARKIDGISITWRIEIEISVEKM